MNMKPLTRTTSLLLVLAVPAALVVYGVLKSGEQQTSSPRVSIEKVAVTNPPASPARTPPTRPKPTAHPGDRPKPVRTTRQIAPRQPKRHSGERLPKRNKVLPSA